MPHMRSIRSTLTALASISLAAGLLVGCSAGITSEDAADTAHASEHAAEHTSEHSVTLRDGWAKAADGMTGLFGTLENHGDHDLVITGVDTEAAGLVELHEITDTGVMQEIAGDVVIPAGGSLELAPGGNHIMLMDMPKPLLAGEEVTVTLLFDDGTSAEFTVLVKDYSGANEEYGGDHMEHDHDEHESH